MKIRLRAFARFREVFGDVTEVELAEDATMAALLEALGKNSPERQKVLFEKTGELKEYVFLMRNRTRVKVDEIDTLVLFDGDEITLYPPVSGG